MQTFRRFVARRGRPKIMYSDNGTDFVGAENAFAKLNWDKIQTYTTAERIKWQFNPPTGSWWGKNHSNRERHAAQGVGSCIIELRGSEHPSL